MIQGQLCDGLRVTSNLLLISILVEDLDESFLRAVVRENSQNKRVCRAIKRANTIFIVDSLQRTKEIKIFQVVHVYAILHDNNNLIFAKFDSEDWLIQYDCFYFT